MNGQNQTAAAAQKEILPQEYIMQLSGGAFVAQAVYVAAKLGISDLLANGAQSVEDLARATEAHERSLYRLLRTLTSLGVFKETERGVFAQTPVSATMTEGKGTLRDMIIWMGEEPHWRVYGNMLHSVKTGKAAWSKVHGADVFPYLFHANRELGAIFNRAMTSFSTITIPAVAAAYDFSQAKVVADIAGGYGHLLAGVLETNPHLQGILFDLKPVCDEGESFLREAGVAARTETVCGDFFEKVPVKADVYMLKHIIHDWDDPECVSILENIRSEMPDHASILIIDAVIPDDDEPHFGKIMDMEMLVSPGGVERTAREFEKLLSDSHLKLNRIIPTASPVSIVEAVKK